MTPPLTRRRVLTGLLAAPMIVRAGVLMPVRQVATARSVYHLPTGELRFEGFKGGETISLIAPSEDVSVPFLWTDNPTEYVMSLVNLPPGRTNVRQLSRPIYLTDAVIEELLR